MSIGHNKLILLTFLPPKFWTSGIVYGKRLRRTKNWEFAGRSWVQICRILAITADAVLLPIGDLPSFGRFQFQQLVRAYPLTTWSAWNRRKKIPQPLHYCDQVCGIRKEQRQPGKCLFHVLGAVPNKKARRNGELDGPRPEQGLQ